MSKNRKKVIPNIAGLDVKEMDDRPRQALEILKESEEKFSLAFRHAPFTCAITTIKDGKYVEVNDNYVQAIGYTRDELIGRTTSEIGIWADANERLRMLGILKIKGRVPQQEFKFRNKSGQIRIGLLSADPVTIAGEPCLVGIMIDITEQKLAEEELRESRVFNEEVLNNTPNPMIIISHPDPIIRYVNPALEKLTGYSAAELVGRRPPFPWWSPQNPQGAFPQGITKNEKNVPEFLCRRKDGTPFWVSFNIKIVNENGKPKYLLGNWDDITDRKQTEEALKASEEKYRTLVNDITLGIFRSTPGAQGRFLEVNPAMEEITGYSRAHLLKMEVCDLYTHPEERETFSREIIYSQGKIYREFRLRKKIPLRLSWGLPIPQCVISQAR